MRKSLLFSAVLGVFLSANPRDGYGMFVEGVSVYLPSHDHMSVLRTEQYQVRGVVRDADGPLAGVTVSVIGKPVFVQTDQNGAYVINAAEGERLRFTIVGYMQRELPVTSNTLDVTMQQDDREIDEVVVTALGIERSRKNLTYSVQNISGDDMRQANQSNIINALQGHIAGAQISSSGGSPGLPSEIILRGSTTLSGDNQPLFIVDGIRVDNSSSDFTVNRISDINPEDIDNLTVLKGAAAAALYGIDAASGAIVITTKKGKQGILQINGSYKSFAETLGRTPRQQGVYTVGTGGVYDASSSSSWGRQFRYDETVYNNIDRFFGTGLTQDINLNINGGSDRLQYYVSGNYRDAGSTIPNTYQEKISLLLKGTAKLSDKITLTTSANYMKNNIQEGLGGASSGGWINDMLTYPLAYDILAYEYPNGEPYYVYKEEEDDGRNALISPMWSVMNNPRNNDVDRIIVNGSVDYKPLDWITLSYRLGQDYSNSRYRTRVTPGTPGDYFEGRLTDSKGTTKIITSTFNSTFDRELSKDFRTTLILGFNSEYYENHTLSYTGVDFLVNDIYSPNVIEAENIRLTETLPRRQRYAVYGDFRLEYKNLLSLGITGRNDWSSTLPANSRSFYSPSYSGSFSYSELFNPNDWYGKLRVSYARVGKDAPIYRTNTSLNQVQTVGGGFVVNATGGNANLRPELTSEFEVGTELSFFQRRLNIDVTHYVKKTEDMIMTPRVPLPSGYVIMTFNLGSLRNRGWEMSVNAVPVKREGFVWNTTVNGWMNRSKMLEFAGDIVTFKYTNAQLNAGSAATTLGDAVLGIVGTDYQRTEEGYVIVGSDGYPLIDGNEKNIGNREPNFNIGWMNNFSYKGFNLAFMWDFRFGGDVLNASRQRMMSTGTAYDIGVWRDKEFVFNGVVEQDDGSYVKNTTPVVMNYSYFANNYYQIGTNFVEKVNWARVRYITLGYSLPKKWYSHLGIKNLGIELSAQNPFLITNYSGGDPEVNSAGPNAGGTGASTMGVDNGAIPLARTYSFGLNISL